MKCECGAITRTKYANIQLFSDPGPSGGSFSTTEVEVQVCAKCGKGQFVVPSEIRERFLRS